MDLKNLYHDIIIDHKRSPRNFRKLEAANHRAIGHNPLCGDRLTVYVALEDETITDLSFEGAGCAISTASASLMTEALKGKTVAEAKAFFESMHAMLTDEGQADLSRLGKLGALEGVKDYPSRVKCATLAWHTLHAALESDSEATVTTE